MAVPDFFLPILFSFFVQISCLIMLLDGLVSYGTLSYSNSRTFLRQVRLFHSIRSVEIGEERIA